MTLVKRNGCVHAHDGQKFVPLRWGAIAKVLGNKAYRHDGRPYTRAELLPKLRFTREGELIVEN